MSVKLSDFLGDRNNNFNFLRFVAASLVIFGHSFPLALGKGSNDPIGQLTGGSITPHGLAVDIFFVISGFLVTSSLTLRNSIVSFVWARILRIYPALIANLLLCVFTVGLFFTTLPAADYIAHPQTKEFLLTNATLRDIKYFLPGVFGNNPFKHAINGSLWTLPYEIRMYLLLGIIWALSRRLFGALVIIITLSVVTSHLFFLVVDAKPSPAIHFARLGSFFGLGALFYVLRARIPLKNWLFISFLLALGSTAILTPKILFQFLYIATLPYLILFLAYIPTGIVRAFNNLGDYSYGLYIFAFPIQQSIIMLSKNIQPYTLFATSFLITFIFAIISWHLVEEPFLKLKSIRLDFATKVRYWMLLINPLAFREKPPLCYRELISSLETDTSPGNGHVAEPDELLRQVASSKTSREALELPKSSKAQTLTRS